MAEAQKGFATLEDVDTGTFVRFIEWAHRGYYTAAGFTTVEYRSPCASSSLSHHEKTPAPEEEYNDEVPLATQDEWDLQPSVVEADWLSAPDPPVFGTKKDKKKGMRTSWEMPNDQPKKYRAPKAREELKEAFISRRYTFRQGVLEIPPPRPNQGPEENYTDVFLSHAQLYVFADKYDVQALKVLALEELYATLAIYTLHPARTGDIITLLQYIYGNTGQSDGGEEDLRQILKTYIGYEMDTLINDGDFRDLMIVDGGSLLGDFITMVGQRISIPA